MKKLIPLLLILVSTITFASAQATNSVVKIHASIATSDYIQPWQSPKRSQVSGSGVIIKDNFIITNAHVVAKGKYIQVSKNKESKKYVAKLKYISHQADLALLEVEDKTFFKNTKQLTFTQNVEEGNNVIVLGYPIGGSSLSTTKGTVSRMETQSYVWSYKYMFAIQIDAAVNSGNSGGAAINNKDELIGIVMQSLNKKEADNIGYIIPSIIVNTFLEDIKDGKVDGYEDSANLISNTKNINLKKYYNLKDNSGAVFSKIDENENTLKLYDILLEIEGKKVSDDGYVDTQYGKQSFSFYTNLKPVGESIDLKVKRGDKVLDLDFKLLRKSEVIKYEYDKDPRYIVFGGLVFSPLTKNVLYAAKQNVKLFSLFYELKEEAKEIKEGVLILDNSFKQNINEGYNPYYNLVYKINGVKVIDFNHCIKLLDESKDEFTIIEFLDSKQKFVFDTKKAKESFEEIKNIYGLDTDRRE